MTPLISSLLVFNGLAIALNASLNRSELRPVKLAFLKLALRLKPISTDTALCRVNAWFVGAMDKFYWGSGRKVFSPIAIARSFMVSTFVVVGLIVVFETVHPWRLQWLPNFVWPTLLLFGLNLFADYVSLLETRTLLAKAVERPRRIRTLLAFLALDLILTSLIYCILALLLFWTVMSLCGQPTGIKWSTPLRLAVNKDAYSPFFYSTFATSAGLYLFVSFSLAVRILVRSRRLRRRILRWLARREKLLAMLSAFISLVVVILMIL